MHTDKNEYQQPIGFPVTGWRPRPHPPKTVMTGRYCALEPLDVAKHGRQLFDANRQAPDGRYWTYLAYGPFDNYAAYQHWLEQTCLGEDPLFYAIVTRPAAKSSPAKAIGLASYLRIQPQVGVIEVGHIHYSPELQRTPAATEAMYLMMKNVFDTLGYRRYEWKCDDLNRPSKNAALRLGFKPEGVFRQATMVKGRNRDTAWFSIVNHEWPALKKAYEAWLHPTNFAANGQQKRKLQDFISG